MEFLTFLVWMFDLFLLLTPFVGRIIIHGHQLISRAKWFIEIDSDTRSLFISGQLIEKLINLHPSSWVLSNRVAEANWFVAAASALSVLVSLDFWNLDSHSAINFLMWLHMIVLGICLIILIVIGVEKVGWFLFSNTYFKNSYRVSWYMSAGICFAISELKELQRYDIFLRFGL